MPAEIHEIAAWMFWFAVIVVSIIIDSTFCGMETGIYVLNKIRLDLRAESGDRTARFLLKMLDNPNNLLSVLLLGTNMFRYIATFAITTLFFMAGAGEKSEWLTVAVATPLLFVTCDSVPKGVFHRLCESLMYKIAWVLRFFNFLFRYTGLSLLIQGVSSILIFLTRAPRNSQALAHHAPAAVIAEGRAEGVLTHSQSIMADRVMSINEVQLLDVMVPICDVVSVSTDVTRQQLIELIEKHNFTRFPVLNEDGSIGGVLNVYKAILAGESSEPLDKLKPSLAISASTPVPDALYKMQRSNHVMAVVAEPGGKHIGIVTIKDLVEEIVGELEAW